MSRFFQGSVIILLFFAFILDSFHIVENIFGISNQQMIANIIHPNSLLFILSVALLLYLSVNKEAVKITKENKKNQLVNEAIEVLDSYFEDKITLEEIVSKKDNKYISKILYILKYGGMQEDLTLGIEKIFNHTLNGYIKLKNGYEYCATIMPIIGMIGTIAGLLIMFAVPDANTSLENKFTGLSIALATTLYSSFITILIFKPKARVVEDMIVDLETKYEDINISAKQFFHKVNLPLLVQIMDEKDAQTKK